MLILSLVLTVIVVFTPAFVWINSLNKILGFDNSLFISGLVFLIGLFKGLLKRRTPQYVAQVNYESLRRLEREKSRSISQLQRVRGNFQKERQLAVKIDNLNRQILTVKAKLGIPISRQFKT